MNLFHFSYGKILNDPLYFEVRNYSTYSLTYPALKSEDLISGLDTEFSSILIMKFCLLYFGVSYFGDPSFCNYCFGDSSFDISCFCDFGDS